MYKSNRSSQASCDLFLVGHVLTLSIICQGHWRSGVKWQPTWMHSTKTTKAHQSDSEDTLKSVRRAYRNSNASSLHINHTQISTFVQLDGNNQWTLNTVVSKSLSMCCESCDLWALPHGSSVTKRSKPSTTHPSVSYPIRARSRLLSGQPLRH